MGSPSDTQQQLDILEEACARNLAVELHHTTLNDELFVARTRFLGMSGNTLFIDTPRSVGKPFTCARGKSISIYFQLNGLQFAFRSQVTQPECVVNLNQKKRVHGVGIARPERVEEGQRREDFRISLACIDPIVVWLHTVNDVEAGYSALDAPRFTGRLVDASRGGMCVLVDVEQQRNFREGDHFCATCVLPEKLLEITLLVQLRHTRRIRDGQAARLGLKFVHWAPEFTRPFLQDFARFCAHLERQSVRRKR
jgi:c-di-GMP-binding flagellar brake protein YcgR